MSQVYIPVAARKLLVGRVASSRYIAQSARLRDLLLYLCDQVLEHGVTEIHEQEVGQAVFGRPPGYDTISDNIVRVYASMLRKRLEQYFSSEGRDEPIIIELPKGNYAPVFLERKVTEIVAPVVPALSPSSGPAFAREKDWKFWIVVGLAAIFAASSLYLHIQRKTTPAAAFAKTQPALREFWSQIFAPNSRTDIVMDDEGVGLYQELTASHIALSDYFNRNYLRELAKKSSLNKLNSEAAASIVLKRQSSYASAAFLWKLSAIANGLNGQTSVHFARDYSFRELKSDNAILLGNHLSNPWIEAFQDHLGLRWQYDGERGGYYPVDTWAPVAERDRFRAGSDGYAMLAMLPNLGGTGSILILSSSGGSALSAAGDFLTRGDSVAGIKALLPRAPRGRFPYFEALLRVKSHSRIPRGTSIVICRSPHF